MCKLLYRSSTCPECRRKTTPSTIQKIYFNVCADRSLLDDPAVLQEQLSDAKLRNNDLQKSLEESNDKVFSEYFYLLFILCKLFFIIYPYLFGAFI